jgi:hypothetical protein
MHHASWVLRCGTASSDAPQAPRVDLVRIVLPSTKRVGRRDIDQPWREQGEARHGSEKVGWGHLLTALIAIGYEFVSDLAIADSHRLARHCSALNVSHCRIRTEA